MLKTTEIIRYVFKRRTLHIMAAHRQTLVTIFYIKTFKNGFYTLVCFVPSKLVRVLYRFKWFLKLCNIKLVSFKFHSLSSKILKNPGIQPTYNLVFKLYWKIVNIIWIIIPSRVWNPDLVRLTRCQRDLSRRPGIFLFCEILFLVHPS